MAPYFILTTEGIFDLESRNRIQTPFSKSVIDSGARDGDKLAVVVNRKEIWIKNGEWIKSTNLTTDVTCIEWYNDGLLLGTEGAHLAYLKRQELEFNKSFDNMQGRDKWNTPWGGPPAVRSLSVSKKGDIFANIHVGWICRSSDAGESWENITSGLEKDVHQVSTHSTKQNIVLAATADGFHISEDRGFTFDRRWASIQQTYQRAVANFPNSDVIVTSVSNGPGGSNSRLYRSEDLGHTWEEVQGLPDKIQLNINTYQISLFEHGHGFVIIGTKNVYVTNNYGLTWNLVISGLPKSYQIL